MGSGLSSHNELVLDNDIDFETFLILKEKYESLRELGYDDSVILENLKLVINF
mgnify:CR=1 FL=1